ncbi:MAG TPA: helix-turn-helix domain-containing protein [Ilumatobacter sp.]|nr:helix-turn-helix domain-containing protein [Ilumatobacter sp.]
MGARDDMIEAAERLVAEHGIAAMSLREVQKAAGQRNKSAAHYHFGDRDGLIAAILTTRMAPINAERARRLTELDARPRPATARDLMEVMVEPLAAATLRPGSCWARFLAQGWTDPVLAEVVRRVAEGEAYRATRDRLVAAVHPDVPKPLRARRVDTVIGMLFLALAAAERQLADTGSLRLPVSAIVADLVDTGTAIITAPSSVTADPVPAGSHSGGT